jgi:uncharacterized membrane protein
VRPRTRILAFGSAALIALAGGLCWAFVQRTLGLVLGVALFSIGLGAIVLLVFLEIGLSEDHARMRDEQRRLNRGERGGEIRQFPWSRRPPRSR